MSIVFSRPGVSFELPPNITHLSIGAHPDDLEFMSVHGILECRRRNTRGFLGVVVASGAGAEEAALRETRRQEQAAAAQIGQYAGLLQLDFESGPLKRGERATLVADLVKLFTALPQPPEIVYTHNPADKHDTHVAVALSVIEALGQVALMHRPARLLGCEVWRGLDWVLDADRVALDVSDGEKLLARLTGVYHSQIREKAYDAAVMGRKRTNATFRDPYSADDMKLCEYAVDLTPLMANSDPTAVEAAMRQLLNRLQEDVVQRIRRLK